MFRGLGGCNAIGGLSMRRWTACTRGHYSSGFRYFYYVPTRQIGSAGRTHSLWASRTEGLFREIEHIYKYFVRSTYN